MKLEQSICEMLSAINQISVNESIPVYVVGGVIRDLLRRQQLKDYDIDLLVDGDAAEFAKKVQLLLGGTLKLFPDFFTAKINNLKITSNQRLDELDFASARTEIYERPGALPTPKRASIADDLARRDFSINAIALPLKEFIEIDWNSLDLFNSPKFFDPLGGLEDINKKHIRVLHENSFTDDPTRLYRALRYQVRIDGTLEPETYENLKNAIKNKLLEKISFKRRINEIKKILLEDNALRVLELLFEHEIFESTFMPYNNALDLALLKQRFESLAALSLSARNNQKINLEHLLIMIFTQSMKSDCSIEIFNDLSIKKSQRSEIANEVQRMRVLDKNYKYSDTGQLFFSLFFKS